MTDGPIEKRWYAPAPAASEDWSKTWLDNLIAEHTRKHGKIQLNGFSLSPTKYGYGNSVEDRWYSGKDEG